MLGDTSQQTRDAMIAKFSDGELRVLVNVAVATEGFDLPDASCVIIARPTQSLALYLQMLGRGLRPKPDGGDCLILDLAGNAILHGLPQQPREWSLAPRGQPPEGEAPVVWCEHCGVVSPAASHNCQSCGAPLGEDCQRCGKWRSWNRWSLKDACKYAHDIVCDHCHRDAHIQDHLPVTTQMEVLADLDDEGSSNSKEVIQIEDAGMTINDSELNSRLASLLSELLEEELHRITSAVEARRSDLHEFIKTRELALSDESVLDGLFEEHLNTLPEGQKPKSNPQKYRMFSEWEDGLRTELADKRTELARLESQPIDKQGIFNSARDRTLSVLKRESETAGLLSDGEIETSLSPLHSNTGWLSLTDKKLDTDGRNPSYLRFPSGKEISINSGYWADFIAEIVNWLIQKGKLSSEDCPISVGRSKKYFINTTPYQSDNSRFRSRRDLLGGMHVNTSFSGKQSVANSNNLLRKFGEDPSKFYIKLQ